MPEPKVVAPKPRAPCEIQFSLKEENSSGTYLEAADPHGQIFIDIKLFGKNVINKFQRRIDKNGHVW